VIDLLIDVVKIQGESKLKVEKDALVNDGNPSFYIYKQFTEEELAKREALRHLGALEKQPTEEKGLVYHYTIILI